MSLPNRDQLRSWLTGRDAPVVLQFAKYGVCGVLAVILYTGIIFMLVRAYPERVAETLPDAERAFNLNIFQAIAFVPANIFAYLMNRTFVFTPGRHRVHREFVWFFVVAVVSTAMGLVATDLLIRFMSAPNWTGTVGSVVASALMNFVCRKYLVFAK